MTYAMRKGISVLLIVALIAGFMAPAAAFGAAAASLVDLDGSYAKKEIEALVQAGIVSGYENGTFRPNQSMTRAELAKMISLAAGLKEKPEGAAVFSDVPRSSWYAGYVGALVDKGVTQGTSDTTFSPDTPVTREELVVFFVRAMGLEDIALKTNADGKALTDFAAVSEWAKAHVALAFKIGFIGGIGNADGTVRFSPKDAAERQALARLTYEIVSNKAAYASKAEALQKETVKAEPEKPAEPATGGGGGSSGRSSKSREEPWETTRNVLNGGGSYQGNLTVERSDTYGPAAGKTTINGTLTLNPGPTGSVTLRNIEATQIVVLSGDKNSIKLSRVAAGGLTINASSNGGNTVRVQSLDNTNIPSTSVQSGAIIESSGGTLGSITVGSGAAGKHIELRGQLDGTVTVSAPGATVSVAKASDGSPTTVASLNVTTSASISSGAGSTVQSVTLSGSGTVSLQGAGAVQQVTFSAGASNSTVTVADGANVQTVNIAAGATGATVNVSGSANVGKIVASSAVKLTGSAAGIELETTSPEVAIDTSELDAQSQASLKANAIAAAVSAINALGTVTPDKAADVVSARNKVNAAKALGAADTDLTNLPVLIAAEALIADHIAVSADKTTLAIGYREGDSPDNVTGSLTLPAAGAKGSAVTWSSSHPAVVGANGAVTQPAAGQPNVTVTLTATVVKGSATATATFTVTVKALAPIAIGSVAASGTYVTVGLNHTVSSVTYSTYSVSDAVYTVSGATYSVTAGGGTYNVGIWPIGGAGQPLKLTGIQSGGAAPKLFTLAFVKPAAAGTYVVKLYTGSAGQSDYVQIAASDGVSLGGNPAPELTQISYGIGDIPGTMRIEYTGSGTVKAKVQSVPISVPDAGSQAPAEAHSFASGNFAVTAGEYIGLYETDAGGIVVKFTQIAVTADKIAVAAPVIAGVNVEPGSAAGSTKLTYAAASGNVLKLQRAPSPAVPVAGKTIGGPAPESYTSGADIPGVAAGQTIRLYEVEAVSGKIVKYADMMLIAEQIRGVLPAGPVTLDYLGHSSFVLVTEQNKILIDPWRPLGFNLPNYELADEAQIQLITTSHEHDDHNYVEAAPTAKAGNNIVYGVRFGQFNGVEEQVHGDVTISTVNVPHFEAAQPWQESNAAFIYKTAGMRIVHLGDGMGPMIDGFDPQQLASLKGVENRIDVLMIPVGNSMGGPLPSAKVLAAIKALAPKAVIPIHPWSSKQTFLDAAAADGFAIQQKQTPVSLDAAALPADGTVIWNVSSASDLMSVHFAATAKSATTADFSLTLPAGATGVNVQLSTDDGATWSHAATSAALNGSSTQAKVTGLTPSTVYKFRLKVKLGMYAGFSGDVKVITDPNQGENPSGAVILEYLVDKLGFHMEEQKVIASQGISKAADLYGYSRIEVLTSGSWNPDPAADSFGTVSLPISADVQQGDELISGLTLASPGHEVWYRLIDDFGQKTAWKQDGTIPYTPANDSMMNGEFIVLGHEGKVRVINDNKMGNYNSVNGHLAIVSKNGVVQQPASIVSNTNTDIAIEGGVQAGDAIKVAFIDPNGNVSSFSSAVTVAAGPINGFDDEHQFMVLGDSGKVKIKNSFGWVTVYISKNGTAQEAVRTDQIDPEIAVAGGLAPGDQIRVAVTLPNSANSTLYSLPVTAAATP